jgi:hypothetical protein
MAATDRLKRPTDARASALIVGEQQPVVDTVVDTVEFAVVQFAIISAEFGPAAVVGSASLERLSRLGADRVDELRRTGRRPVGLACGQ